MSKFVWTAKHQARLVELAEQGKTSAEIAAELGCKLNLVRERARRHGIKLRRMISKPFDWTPERDAELLRRYETESASDIAESMGCTMSVLYNRAWRIGAKKTSEWARKCTRERWEQGRLDGARAGHFQRGRMPHNKGVPASKWRRCEAGEATQFKPGEMPYNWVPVGTLRVTANGVLEIKVSEGGGKNSRQSGWKTYRKWLWEQHNGPTPPGHVVRFKDGHATTDPARISIDTIECIPASENMRRNSYHILLPADVAQLVQLRAVLTRKINRKLKEKEDER